jgi:hypothetical protein
MIETAQNLLALALMSASGQKAKYSLRANADRCCLVADMQRLLQAVRFVRPRSRSDRDPFSFHMVLGNLDV